MLDDKIKILKNYFKKGRCLIAFLYDFQIKEAQLHLIEYLREKGYGQRK
jgi:hypothetical protein